MTPGRPCDIGTLAPRRPLWMLEPSDDSGTRACDLVRGLMRRLHPDVVHVDIVEDAVEFRGPSEVPLRGLCVVAVTGSEPSVEFGGLDSQP
jgi:hypothetical protein